MAAVLLAACANAAEPRPAPNVDTAVVNALRAGPARVTVQLFVPGDSATEDGHRQSIALAQSQVLTELAGTQFQLARRPASVPFLTLVIDRDALRRLTAMQGLVARVYLDSRLAPQSKRSVRSAIHQAGINQ